MAGSVIFLYLFQTFFLLVFPQFLPVLCNDLCDFRIYCPAEWGKRNKSNQIYDGKSQPADHDKNRGMGDNITKLKHTQRANHWKNYA